LVNVLWRGRFVDREVPNSEIAALFDMTAEIADQELADASEMEAAASFPADAYRTLGAAGLLSLPYQGEYGGAELASEFSLQVLEELAYSWLAVGIGVSVHNLACFPLAVYGDPDQQQEHLGQMLSGQTLGGYCLSESHSGSDAAALSTRAELNGENYVVNGSKAWITHGPVANFFSVMARTGEGGPKGISCFLVDGQAPGLQAASPERKMGANSSPTSAVVFEDVVVPAGNRIGAEGQGFSIALAALDAGRLGIAACAVGLAQAALDTAVAYAQDRRQFNRAIIDFQGISFTLADMAAAIYAARSAYLAAARLKDLGEPFSTQAAMAKLIATDTAMRVASDAVGILGGAGYTRDHPVERFFREAKVLQIVEGTNQIQRMVIGRALHT
jgi:alkylation response protein AidB-like acyl-CoA dehydrogenase